MSEEPPDLSTEIRGHEWTEFSLSEYIDDQREDLEKIADAEYPVSPVVQALLDRRDRDELKC